MLTAQNVAWYKDIDEGDSHLTGELGTSFGKLDREKFNLVPGFILTSNAHLDFLKNTNILKRVNNLVSSITPGTIEQTSKHIEEFILDSAFPEKLGDEINLHTQKLLGDKSEFLSLLFSPTNRHFSKSFNISDIKSKDLLNLVKKSWAGLYNPDFLLKLHENRLNFSKLTGALIVKKQLPFSRIGTLYTSDPQTGDKNMLVITYIKDDGTESKYELSKSYKTVIKRQTNEIFQISDSLINKIYELGMGLENIFYFPQEVSFILSNGSIYIDRMKPLNIKDLDTTKNLYIHKSFYKN
jgi:phosphoenolpyruvate synthase/pyruvate phosphate dikinase